MFGQTARNLTAREMDIAAQRMNARLLNEETLLFGFTLRAIEQRHRLVEPVQHRKSHGPTPTGAKSRLPGGGYIHRHAKGRNGLFGSAEALPQFARKTGQRCTSGIRVRQRQAAFSQGQGLLDTVGGSGGLGCRKIGRGDVWIFGHIKMLGPQR